MKKIIIIISILLLLTFWQSNIDERPDQYSFSTINIVKLKTKFDLSCIFNFPNVQKIEKVYLGPWAPMRKIVLPDNAYPSREKMIEIKSSPKIAVLIDLSNGLSASLRLGRFRSYEDSYLAFIDSVPSSRQWKKTLFSGNTLENSTVITIKGDFNITAEAYLFYKNCLCCFGFTSRDQEISENDYLLLDEFIKNMRILIDKSIN